MTPPPIDDDRIDKIRTAFTAKRELYEEKQRQSESQEAASCQRLRKRLRENHDLQWKVLFNAHPDFSRNTPPVLGPIEDVGNGSFRVTVHLVDSLTKEVSNPVSIIISESSL